MLGGWHFYYNHPSPPLLHTALCPLPFSLPPQKKKRWPLRPATPPTWPLAPVCAPNVCVAGRRERKAGDWPEGVATDTEGFFTGWTTAARHRSTSDHAYAVAAEETRRQAPPDDTGVAAGAAGPRPAQTPGPRRTTVGFNSSTRRRPGRPGAAAVAVVACHGVVVVNTAVHGPPAFSSTLPAVPARRRRGLSRDRKKAQRALRAVACFGQGVRLRRIFALGLHRCRVDDGSVVPHRRFFLGRGGVVWWWGSGWQWRCQRPPRRLR